jgi:hypothetical protein
VRHDPRPRPELGQELRAEPSVEIGREVERHHRRLAQVGREEIVLAEGHPLGELEPAGAGVGLRHQRRVDLEAHAAGPAIPRRRDDDPTIAGPEIVDDVIASYGREPQHLVHHDQGCADVRHLLARDVAASRGERESEPDRGPSHGGPFYRTGSLDLDTSSGV